jgi:hypothetical protein
MSSSTLPLEAFDVDSHHCKTGLSIITKYNTSLRMASQRYHFFVDEEGHRATECQAA